MGLHHRPVLASKAVVLKSFIAAYQKNAFVSPNTATTDKTAHTMKMKVTVVKQDVQPGMIKEGATHEILTDII